MNEFLGWLNLLVVVIVAALAVFFTAAYITGDGFSDTEQRVFVCGLGALMLVGAVGYIVDPNSPPRKRRRR